MAETNHVRKLFQKKQVCNPYVDMMLQSNYMDKYSKFKMSKACRDYDLIKYDSITRFFSIFKKLNNRSKQLLENTFIIANFIKNKEIKEIKQLDFVEMTINSLAADFDYFVPFDEAYTDELTKYQKYFTQFMKHYNHPDFKYYIDIYKQIPNNFIKFENQSKRVLFNLNNVDLNIELPYYHNNLLNRPNPYDMAVYIFLKPAEIDKYTYSPRFHLTANLIAKKFKIGYFFEKQYSCDFSNTIERTVNLYLFDTRLNVLKTLIQDRFDPLNFPNQTIILDIKQIGIDYESGLKIIERKIKKENDMKRSHIERKSNFDKSDITHKYSDIKRKPTPLRQTYEPESQVTDDLRSPNARNMHPDLINTYYQLNSKELENPYTGVLNYTYKYKYEWGFMKKIDGEIKNYVGIEGKYKIKYKEKEAIITEQEVGLPQIKLKVYC